MDEARKLAIVVWYLGGFALLFIGALIQVGPFAWAAAWQVRHWGGDNLVLSFLPGFVVLAAPVVVLQLVPRKPDWPFLCGAQDALSSRRGVQSVPPSPDRMARLLLLLAKGGLIFSLLSLIAGVGGYFLVQALGDRGAGMPLPEIPVAAMTVDTLPTFARLDGVIAHPEAYWVHDHTVRQTSYHDVYYPLTRSDWKPGDAVLLLEEDSAVADDNAAPPGISRPGPVEGKLERGSLPGWMITAMRRSGVAVVDDPVVLLRRDLGGIEPGADMVGAVMAPVLGVLFALFSAGISITWLYRRRRLLREAVLPGSDGRLS